MSKPADDDSRVLNVVVFCLIVAVLGYGLWQQEKSIRRLDRTDRIACGFLIADAQTRARQSVNSSHLLMQQAAYIGEIARAKKHTEQVIGLFNKRPKGQTAKQRAATDLFVDYLLGEVDLRQAQRAVEEARANTTRANLRLNKKLVTKARALAAGLHC